MYIFSRHAALNQQLYIYIMIINIIILIILIVIYYVYSIYTYKSILWVSVYFVNVPCMDDMHLFYIFSLCLSRHTVKRNTIKGLCVCVYVCVAILFLQSPCRPADFTNDFVHKVPPPI